MAIIQPVKFKQLTWKAKIVSKLFYMVLQINVNNNQIINIYFHCIILYY